MSEKHAQIHAKIRELYGEEGLQTFLSLREFGTAHPFCIPAKTRSDGPYDVLRSRVVDSLLCFWSPLQATYVPFEVKDCLHSVFQCAETHKFVRVDVYVSVEDDTIRNIEEEITAHTRMKYLKINNQSFHNITLRLRAKHGPVHMEHMAVRNCSVDAADLPEKTLMLDRLEIEKTCVLHATKIQIAHLAIYNQGRRFKVKESFPHCEDVKVYLCKDKVFTAGNFIFMNQFNSLLEMLETRSGITIYCRFSLAEHGSILKTLRRELRSRIKHQKTVGDYDTILIHEMDEGSTIEYPFDPPV